MSSLDALSDLLARAAQTASATARPIAVKEILDTLAPYRQVRAHAIVDTNDDYLLLVMRLLAGEGGYVDAESAVRTACAAELTSPNPDLFVVRSHGHATVRLTGLRSSAGASASAPASAPTPASAPAPSPAPAPAVAPEIPPPPAAPPAPSPIPESAPIADLPEVIVDTPEQPPAPSDTDAGPSCVACAHPLPADRDIRFCPWCGVDQTIKRCPGCGSELETTWRFCVTCGRQA